MRLSDRIETRTKQSVRQNERSTRTGGEKHGYGDKTEKTQR